MANYATTFDFITRSGLGVQVLDENIGTGDNSETDFDLKNDNITANSYTLSHAPDGSNSFTALTETTHYTLDKDTGRVVLTASGVTAVGTDKIYATYWHSPEQFPDSVITEYLDSAEDNIDLITGRKWDSAVTQTEYFDGRRALGYPTTNHPFTQDFDAPDFLMLKNHNVTKISFVYLLQRPANIDKFFNYDDDAATFTDSTEEINDIEEDLVTLFASTPATSDIVYIGHSQKFIGLETNLSTDGTGSPAITWEYWNGTAWAAVPNLTDTETGASTFESSGRFTWTLPLGWQETAVNGSTQFWVRGRLTTGYTVGPVAASLSIKDSIDRILQPKNIVFLDYGKVWFVDTSIPNGTQNVRVDYSYGQSTVPTYIKELTILIASVQAYVTLSGGSFDDATSFQLGSKQVTVGEVFVNIREVISQQRKRIDEILKAIGTRVDVSGI